MFFLKIWNFNQLLPMFIKTEDWPTLTQFNLNLISTLIACFFFAAFANIYSHSNFHLGRLTRNSFIKTDPKLFFPIRAQFSALLDVYHLRLSHLPLSWCIFTVFTLLLRRCSILPSKAKAAVLPPPSPFFISLVLSTLCR